MLRDKQHKCFSNGQNASNTRGDLPALCERAQAGDAMAEAELLAVLYPKVLHYVNRQTQRTDIVEDVVQDSFIILVRKIRSGAIDDPAKVIAYARAIARNTLVARCRRLARHAEVEFDGDIVASDHSPLEDALIDEVHLLIREGIDQLGQERDRQLLHSWLHREPDVNEFCSMLKVSRDHVYRIVFRARRRLRDVLLASVRGKQLLET